MDPTTAVLITIYLIPVSLLDNVLRPLVMARGLDTPMLVILIGVLGRYHFLRDHRPLFRAHCFGRDLGTACGLDQRARKHLGWLFPSR